MNNIIIRKETKEDTVPEGGSANAEDIFGARNMADAICQKVHMNIILVEYPGYSVYLKEPDSEELLNDTKIIYTYFRYFIRNWKNFKN